MAVRTSFYANQLRQELAKRNRIYARDRVHVESYGSAPVIVYAPEGDCHGNFFDAAYAEIFARPEWGRRFDKVHAQAARSLPKVERRWRELDSSTSSDALLMNVFCTPGVATSPAVRSTLGIDDDSLPIFGWKARVPLVSGRFDRTEVDLRLGSLLIEAKLTEGDFQSCETIVVKQYRDFEAVFDPALLPQFELPPKRRKEPAEFPENYSQEFESVLIDPDQSPQTFFPDMAAQLVPANQLALNDCASAASGYASYQLIRNVLAAYAEQCSFCVVYDERRPDLREDWFAVMAAVKSAELRTRLKALTWQELSPFLPEKLQEFLDCKYGIVAPGRTPTPISAEAALE